jgi:hypothetical protein
VDPVPDDFIYYPVNIDSTLNMGTPFGVSQHHAESKFHTH